MKIGKVLEKPIHEIKPIKRNGHQGRTKAPRLQNFSFPSSFPQQPNIEKEIEGAKCMETTNSEIGGGSTNGFVGVSKV